MTTINSSNDRRGDGHRTRPGVRAALAGLLLMAAGVAAAQMQAFSFEIFPAQPGAQEAVYVRVNVPDCMALGGVSHAEGRLMVSVRQTGCSIPRPGFTRPIDASLGKLPPGDYRVQVINDSASPPILAAEQALVVAPLPIGVIYSPLDPHLDLSGWWTTQDPSSGQGWLIEHKLPDRLIFSWVTYAADGTPVWLNMQTTRRQGRSYIGPVYRSERDADEVIRTLVGEGRFEFDTADSSVFTLVPTDPALPPSTYPLRRLPF
jgi:hypothetical protein